MFVRITVVDITDVVVSDVELYEVIDKLSFDIFVLLVFFFTVLFGWEKENTQLINNKLYDDC